MAVLNDLFKAILRVSQMNRPKPYMNPELHYENAGRLLLIHIVSLLKYFAYFAESDNQLNLTCMSRGHTRKIRE